MFFENEQLNLNAFVYVHQIKYFEFLLIRAWWLCSSLVPVCNEHILADIESETKSSFLEQLKMQKVQNIPDMCVLLFEHVNFEANLKNNC